jgi:hypothetical protein
MWNYSGSSRELFKLCVTEYVRQAQRERVSFKRGWRKVSWRKCENVRMLQCCLREVVILYTNVSFMNVWFVTLVVGTDLGANFKADNSRCSPVKACLELYLRKICFKMLLLPYCHVFQWLRRGFGLVNQFIGSSLVINTVNSYTLEITVTIAHATSHTCLLILLLATQLFPWNFETQVKSIPESVRVTLRLTVSHSVCLGVEPRLGLMTKY